jgi:hypothetical protein
VKRPTILIIFLLCLLATPSFAVSIDGKAWDWANIPVYHACRSHPLSRDRVGMDMKSVKMYLGRQNIYIYVEGRSVSGMKYDDGEGFRKTSLRVSFNSAQSPLNRVRAATEIKQPWVIKLASPAQETKYLGSKQDKYWARGKYGNNYYYEMKVPVFISKKGIHVGSLSGPLVRLSKQYSGSRNTLSDVLINCVDMKTHRLVDTTQFSIKKDGL